MKNEPKGVPLRIYPSALTSNKILFVILELMICRGDYMMFDWLMAATVNEEIIKDLQDKVISIQDHQISFLNDFSANLLAVIGIIVGVAAVVQVVIAWMIRTANKRSEDKMLEAEKKMNEAQIVIKQVNSDIEKLEQYRNEVNQHRQETVGRFFQLNTELDQRLKELEEMQKSVETLANLNEIKQTLDSAERTLNVAIQRIRNMMRGKWGKELGELLYEQYEKAQVQLLETQFFSGEVEKGGTRPTHEMKNEAYELKNVANSILLKVSEIDVKQFSKEQKEKKSEDENI